MDYSETLIEEEKPKKKGKKKSEGDDDGNVHLDIYEQALSGGKGK